MPALVSALPDVGRAASGGQQPDQFGVPGWCRPGSGRRAGGAAQPPGPLPRLRPYQRWPARPWVRWTRGSSWITGGRLHDGERWSRLVPCASFRKSPAPGPPPRRVHHPRHPPEAEFPDIVAIDTLHFDRSEQAAVAVIAIAAYARDSNFLGPPHPGTPGLDEGPTPEMRKRRLREPEDFPVSVQFSDGRKAVSRRPRGDSEPAGPILQSRGGGAGPWTGSPDNPGAASAVNAMARATELEGPGSAPA
jgi:hypothetical protein